MCRLIECLCAGTCWGTSRTTSTSPRPGCRSTSPIGSRTCSSLPPRSARRLSPFFPVLGIRIHWKRKHFWADKSRNRFTFLTWKVVQLRPFFTEFSYYSLLKCLLRKQTVRYGNRTGTLGPDTAFLKLQNLKALTLQPWLSDDSLMWNSLIWSEGNFVYICEYRGFESAQLSCGSVSRASFSLKADADPTFHFNADPDPPFHSNVDPDPGETLAEYGRCPNV